MPLRQIYVRELNRRAALQAHRAIGRFGAIGGSSAAWPTPNPAAPPTQVSTPVATAAPAAQPEKVVECVPAVKPVTPKTAAPAAKASTASAATKEQEREAMKMAPRPQSPTPEKELQADTESVCGDVTSRSGQKGGGVSLQHGQMNEIYLSDSELEKIQEQIDELTRMFDEEDFNSKSKGKAVAQPPRAHQNASSGKRKSSGRRRAGRMDTRGGRPRDTPFAPSMMDRRKTSAGLKRKASETGELEQGSEHEDASRSRRLNRFTGLPGWTDKRDSTYM